jgi:hypothetical protein
MYILPGDVNVSTEDEMMEVLKIVAMKRTICPICGTKVIARIKWLGEDDAEVFNKLPENIGKINPICGGCGTIQDNIADSMMWS